MKRKVGFWVLIYVGIILSIFYVIGQTSAVFNYDYTVSIGMQESEEEIGKSGVAFAKGFGFGDTVIYLPLMIAGIIGLIKSRKWGKYSMFGAMAITAYWPMVNLYAAFMEGMNLSADKLLAYSILLPLITIYGLWGMWYLYKNR